MRRNPTVGMFVGDEEIERRERKRLGIAQTEPVQGETPEEIAERIAKCYDVYFVYTVPESSALYRDTLSALRNERERALRDAARLECVFCAGAEGFNPLPVEAETGSYVHRNEPPQGQAGVYCKTAGINALIAAIRGGR